jgi:acyl-coenzyme A thioesterase PaaI-like protein
MNDRVSLCRGCRVGGRSCRFGADDFVATGPDEAVLHLTCPADFQGGPDVAHGGWISGVFDDALGRFLTHTGVLTVTATLTVDFLMPVPVEQPLTVTVLIEAREGRRLTMSGVLTLAGDPRPRAKAHGVWVERRPDHFERHQAQIADYLAAPSDADPI